MIKLRISYTDEKELQDTIRKLEKEFRILYKSKGAKGNNPKYKDSEYRIIYLNIEGKSEK